MKYCWKIISVSPFGRRLHGRRGLKCRVNWKVKQRYERRRLHGRRGVKSIWLSGEGGKQKSPPSRAAWIEMAIQNGGNSAKVKSPPSRAAWIEIATVWRRLTASPSPPSRAAWIEITMNAESSQNTVASPPSRAAWIEIRGERVIEMTPSVAAFTGGVD